MGYAEYRYVKVPPDPILLLWLFIVILIILKVL